MIEERASMQTDEWSRQPDLNRRPTVYETVALPTELCRPGGRALLLTARDSWGQVRERLPTVAPTVSPRPASPRRARPGDQAAGWPRTGPATSSRPGRR